MNSCFRILKWVCVILPTCLVGVSVFPQSITLEDLWLNYKYYARQAGPLNWMEGGDYYSDLRYIEKAPAIIKFDVNTGLAVDTICYGIDDPRTVEIDTLEFSDYQFSEGEGKILLTVDRKAIYRRSSRAEYMIYTVDKSAVEVVSDQGLQTSSTFSPDGSSICFTRNNNLFYKNLIKNSEVNITVDGKDRLIINGRADWVYEEEFSFTKAYFWSPDSRYIAYYKFDESLVPEYQMQLWGDSIRPSLHTFKYPKAGEKNSDVTIWVFDTQTGRSKLILDETGNDNYIPRVQWTNQSGLLAIQRLNRLQNRLEIIHVDVSSLDLRTIYNEQSSTYVDVPDQLFYLKDNLGFLITSEKDGFKHLYHYSMDGELIKQVTSGGWEIRSVEGIDESHNQVYYSSTESSELENHLYSVNLLNGKKRKLIKANGYHDVDLSPSFNHYVKTSSTIDNPYFVSLNTIDDVQVRVLQDNRAVINQLDSVTLGKCSFFSFKNESGEKLNGWMITPPNFDKNKKYPVLLYTYGGPGYQTVKNSWLGFNGIWFQMLAQQGYIVASVDGRGTGGRGAAFKKVTYGNLGKFETLDQIAAAKYFSKQKFVDSKRIGVWGWSFGGYLSSLCLAKGSDYFKMAIAVAPVTNWRFYDTIYTERYLKKPQDNASGYDHNSPLFFADRIKGNFLLIHGTGDDNVHVQNSMALQAKLIEAGIPFDSFMYPDKNHGIYGGKTRFHLYSKMTNFILNNL